MSNQKPLGKCCFVFNQRYGAMFICAFSFCYSLYCGVAIYNNDVRLQSGGYNPFTNKLQIYFGIVGMLFAYIGLAGVIDGKVGMLSIFNTYQFLEILLFLVVFVADMAELRKCDKWASSIESQVHYNMTLDSISKKGLCPVARLSYVVGFAVDFALQLHFTWVVYDYKGKLDHNPAFMISFADGFYDDGRWSDDARHMTFFDENMGEPSEYLGPPLQKPSENYGQGYGAL